MTIKKDDLPPYHELFELPEGESAKDFPPPPNFNAIKVWISRYGGPNGVTKCPRPFLLSEIPDMMAFHDMFGGGRYSVEGRTLGGQFYARRDFVLDGAPKPLIQSEGSPEPPPPTHTAQGVAISGMGGELPKDPMSLLIVVMMQNAERAEQRAERQATLQAQQAQQQAQMAIENMKLIATVLGGQRAGTDPAVAQAFGSMTELVKAQISVAHAPQPVAPQRSVEEEMKRAQDLLSLAKKIAPSETPEKFGDILKELFAIVPPEVVQSAAASLLQGGNGVAVVQQAPPLLVEPVG
jgi:hypothetical protein